MTAKANILLVDDHPENLLALEAVLKGLGHNLVKAGSGAEALRRLLEQDFAVILLDVQMSGMDGFETAALIRQREKSRHTPIIFLTAINKADVYVFKGYSHGAVDYIFKPFVPDVLKAKVAVFVDLFNKTERIKEQARRLQELERAEHQKELAEAHAQRDRFFSLPLNLMGIVGFDGFLKELNPAWEAALGCSRKELLSKPFIKLVHPDDRAAMNAAWQRLREGGEGPVSLESRCLTKEGAPRWFLWSAAAYARENVYYAVAQDITESKKAEEALRALKEGLEERVEERTRELSQANSELKIQIAERRRAEERLSRQAAELARSNAELEQFAYVASHDLREPLRKVTSFVELLARRYQGRLDEGADGYIRYIVEGVARMEALISGLLTYSRTGKGEKALELVDCGSVLEKAVGNLSVLIEEGRAVVTHDPLPTVRADSLQLTELFQNLIGNALKFRGAQPPLVHVGARAKDGEWLFFVQDNGIGIDPQYHERIFTIFKRLHTRDKYPGTGIGLAICKKVVERHRGRIWVESEAGKGATFFFTLPAKAE